MLKQHRNTPAPGTTAHNDQDQGDDAREAAAAEAVEHWFKESSAAIIAAWFCALTLLVYSLWPGFHSPGVAFGAKGLACAAALAGSYGLYAFVRVHIADRLGRRS
jgi:hypothetical protein